MFNWFAKICKKILKDPCKNCIVQPVCFNTFLGDHKYVKKYQDCKQYRNYKKKSRKIESIFDNIHDGILSVLVLIFIIWIIVTFIIGITEQYQLIFG